MALAALPSGGAPLPGVVREVREDCVQLDSGQRLAWGCVRRVLIDGTPVPRQVVAPGDQVLSWAGGTLVLRPCLVRGAFLDLRFGELLLGKANLLLPEGAEIRCNGRPVAASQLPRGAVALARLNPATGRVGRLEVVDPGNSAGVGRVWAVRAGLEPGALAPSRALRAGETLHLELRAPAGGEARFDLAGVAWSWPAREVKTGLYRARFLVPPGLDARGTFVLGHWRRRGDERAVRVGPTVSLAPTPPGLAQFGPKGTASGRSAVFASYESPGAAIEASRVRLWLDGVDRTRLARRTVDLVWWQPPDLLPPGPHQVRVLVVDTAGNQVEHSWSFLVPQP